MDLLHPSCIPPEVFLRNMFLCSTLESPDVCDSDIKVHKVIPRQIQQTDLATRQQCVLTYEICSQETGVEATGEMAAVVSTMRP